MLLTFLFVACFLVTEIIVSQFAAAGPLIRFVLRVVLLIQYTLLLKYFFEYLENRGISRGKKELSGYSIVEKETETDHKTVKRKEDERHNDKLRSGSAETEK